MRTFLWLFAGFALYALSGILERMGDFAPLATEGGSGERLGYHGVALVVLLGGLACFVRAAVLAFHRIRGGRARPTAVAPAVAGSKPEGPSDFDPDAALARYLARKDGEPTPGQQITRPKPAPGGFGRRGL